MKCSICKKEYKWRGQTENPRYCSLDCYDVRFDPIEERLIEDFLKFADIKSDDVLYDLGCGDGRLVMAAAMKFQAHAVGVEIQHKISGYVYWPGTSYLKEQNFMETDLSKATIVTLFLSEKANLALRDKLWKELPANSRIISYCHGMGNWLPDASKVVQGDVRENHFYRWNLPIDREVKPWSL
jgi:hypothetical protein